MVNYICAAGTMAESPDDVQLRTLQAIDGRGPTASHTVIPAVPVEMTYAQLANGVANDDCR